MSDPNGVLVEAVSPESPRCCEAGTSAPSDADDEASAAAFGGASADAAAPAGAGLAKPGSAVEPVLALSGDPSPEAAAPQSGWGRLLSSLVQMGGAASR